MGRSPAVLDSARLDSRFVALRDETLESDDHCIECGAKLTPDELQAVMETGGPPLCAIHAAEDEPGLEVAEEDDFGA